MKFIHKGQPFPIGRLPLAVSDMALEVLYFQENPVAVHYVEEYPTGDDVRDRLCYRIDVLWQEGYYASQKAVTREVKVDEAR